MDIHFDSVRVHRGRRLALEVPALTIRSGAVTALLGPNGSGKTTLLRAIAALDRPESGQVMLGSLPVRPDRRTRDALALSFQSPVFLAGNVHGNLDLGLRLRRVAREERERRIGEAATALRIEHLLSRDARGLSGGEAQRANLARALALRTPVTLLDEPLAGLDEPSREALIRELPAILARLDTVVLVTHDRTEAAMLAEDVVILLEGRVHAAGSLATVFGSPPDSGAARFLGWTVIERRSESLAVRPGAFVLGPGEHTFELAVDRVVDLGQRWQLVGRIEGASAIVDGRRSPPREPLVPVSAAACDVLRL